MPRACLLQLCCIKKPYQKERHLRLTLATGEAASATPAAAHARHAGTTAERPPSRRRAHGFPLRSRALTVDSRRVLSSRLWTALDLQAHQALPPAICERAVVLPPEDIASRLSPPLHGTLPHPHMHSALPQHEGRGTEPLERSVVAQRTSPHGSALRHQMIHVHPLARPWGHIAHPAPPPDCPVDVAA